MRRLGFILLIALLGLSFLPNPLPFALVFLIRVLSVLGIVLLYLKEVFLTNRFFVLLAALVPVYGLAFAYPLVLPWAHGLTLSLGVLLLADAIVLFNPALVIRAKRRLPNLLSLGDANPVFLELENDYPLGLRMTIVDELPYQLQKRDFSLNYFLPGRSQETVRYEIFPKVRGAYNFGQLHLFLRSILGLMERRKSFELSTEKPVYPSVLQMKKYELIAMSRIATQAGVKKVRRLGHSYEFEQIRNYVKGDDYRSINWKATGRRGGQLMVNQYEDERSQQIFAVIDKSRSMKMPFGGLSLMDHAINSALVICNIALQKHDKAGLLSFSDKIGSTIRAESNGQQLQRILEALYREQPHNGEANFELLYTATRQFINRRSLVFLFTNFESFSAMERVLPLLRRINRLHLLVVIFFENTGVLDYAQTEATSTEDIYFKTTAAKFVEEKYRMVQELRQYGIQSILTRPEDLSINTINKYLELKARGMI